jgi:hypothetical protein
MTVPMGVVMARACEIDDGVGDGERLDDEVGAEVQLLARGHLLEVRRQPVLLQFLLLETDGQFASVDGRIRWKLWNNVRERTDVILVGMGEDDALETIHALEEVGDIRDDIVHPEEFFVGEHLAAIDHDDIPVIFE